MATAKFKSNSPYLVKPQFNKDDKKPRQAITVALIGLGRIGVMYLSNITSNRNMKLKHVVISPRQCEDSVRGKFNIRESVNVTRDLNTALADREVNGVIITSSTDSHAGLILSSLNAGKAVYCEKPLSRDLEQTKTCYRAAREKDVPLFCAFNRRFDPTYSRICARARAGAVGHIQTIKSVSRDSPLIPHDYIGPSGGILDDFAVHDIDLLMWVTGDVPVQVFVAGNVQIPEFSDHHDYDNMIILLTFKTGTLGTIDLNRFSSYGYDQRLEVFGAGGMLESAPSRVNHVTSHSQSATSSAPLYHSFPSHYHQAFRNQLDHFVDLVNLQTELCVTMEMTLAVSKVVEACKGSLRSGAPVTLTWDEDEIPKYS